MGALKNRADRGRLRLFKIPARKHLIQGLPSQIGSADAELRKAKEMGLIKIVTPGCTAVVKTGTASTPVNWSLGSLTKISGFFRSIRLFFFGRVFTLSNCHLVEPLRGQSINGYLLSIPQRGILVEIKACEKFYHRHIVDIPRIKFRAQRRYQSR